ncbi:hypothetical protein Fuma_05537 [Fuerstiella marisgermanici]|uniref:Uncharacterized protein n=1 Tax=Fuerstiella marisgermanici TaxID=1891926 RepID=A0A1P8WP85_9PLAN|nr:hypothetical protein Fuma_05537 [Fuerstiella marisgermanici]
MTQLIELPAAPFNASRVPHLTSIHAQPYKENASIGLRRILISFPNRKWTRADDNCWCLCLLFSRRMESASACPTGAGRRLAYFPENVAHERSLLRSTGTHMLKKSTPPDTAFDVGSRTNSRHDSSCASVR